MKENNFKQFLKNYFFYFQKYLLNFGWKCFWYYCLNLSKLKFVDNSYIAVIYGDNSS